jgi:predicted Zn-dependent protease
MTMATLAGIAAGVLLGVGGPAAATATAIGQSAMLAYSRDDESQADQLGLTYLTDSGYGGRGLMTGLEKIRSRQWFGSDDFPTYLSTHPASEDRIAYIDSWLQAHKETVEQTIKIDPLPFRMAQTRLIALYGDETIAKQKYQSAVQQSPDDPMAHYGYALILAKTGDRSTAIEHLKKALEKMAFNPYILTDIGRLYYLQGHYQEALDSLEGAVSISPDYPDGIFYLSKTYMEMGKLKKAVTLLEDMIAKTRDHNLARYTLAEAYGKLGEAGQAHYHLGLYYFSKKDAKNALFHLKRASKIIKDPDQLKKIDKKIKIIEKKISGDQKRQKG